jgi:hypothetical protein
MQMTHDPAPEKADPAKHDNNLHHGASCSLWLTKKLLRAPLLAYTSGVEARSADAHHQTGTTLQAIAAMRCARVTACQVVLADKQVE